MSTGSVISVEKKPYYSTYGAHSDTGVEGVFGAGELLAPLNRHGGQIGDGGILVDGGEGGARRVF